MSNSIILYVDGACRGNPGLGGWGVYMLDSNQQAQYYCGGMADTTNNRMELTAAIEGLLLCPKDSKIQIWTDSTYVKNGITQWIHNWKKKNWKDVKNVEYWLKLDEICQTRDIDWQWVKGHAGIEGNEFADKLANRGADLVLQDGEIAQHVVKLNALESDDYHIQQKTAELTVNVQKKEDPQPESHLPSDDWLLQDPFGLDNDLSETTEESAEETEEVKTKAKKTSRKKKIKALSDEEVQQYVVMTPAKLELVGKRQLILDTETTGFYYQNGDRVIEVGAIEMINRKLTGSSIHIYIQPEKEVGESEQIHGISDEFLKDKPLFAQIAEILYQYLKGAELIAHNASFDMNFLDMEFEKAGYGKLTDVCEVTDTLALAKQKHPGQKNSLDALVKRYSDMIPERDRTFHGALLDSEILADVYLAMTGGQVTLDIDETMSNETGAIATTYAGSINQNVELAVIYPSEEELQQHQQWMVNYTKEKGKASLFETLEMLGGSDFEKLPS